MRGADVLLDTNAVSALLEGDTILRLMLKGTASRALCSTVLGELYYAATQSARRAENLLNIQQLESSLPVLAIGRETAVVYGNLKADLRRRGRPIPENDLWIAASAMEHGLVLVTRDGHFEVVEGLLRLGW